MPEAPGQGAVDVLWVLDNSISMEDEAAWFEDMAAAYFTGYGDADVHVGVTTTDTDAPDAGGITWAEASCLYDTACLAAWQDTIEVGTSGSDFERGFDAAILALSPPLVDTTNAGFFRPGGAHVVAFLSDENDCSGLEGGSGEDCYAHAEELTPEDELLRALLALDPDGTLQVSGIIGPEGAAMCESTPPGRRYASAIEATSGVEVSVCDPDIAAGYAAIAAGAVAVPDSFALPEAADPDSIEVSVGGEIVPEEGWTYDEAAWTVTIHAPYTPEDGESVVIRYRAG